MLQTGGSTLYTEGFAAATCTLCVRVGEHKFSTQRVLVPVHHSANHCEHGTRLYEHLHACWEGNGGRAHPFRTNTDLHTFLEHTARTDTLTHRPHNTLTLSCTLSRHAHHTHHTTEPAGRTHTTTRRTSSHLPSPPPHRTCPASQRSSVCMTCRCSRLRDTHTLTERNRQARQVAHVRVRTPRRTPSASGFFSSSDVMRARAASV